MSDHHDTYIGSKVQRWTKWATGFIKVPCLDGAAKAADAFLIDSSCSECRKRSLSGQNLG
jgi:hypothetical protein